VTAVSADPAPANGVSALHGAEPPRGKVVIVAGPTASGKSNVALAIAEKFSGDVINADSMQLYRELRVITARPDDDTMARAPHRLFGVLPAAERCSAGRWLSLALAEIAATLARGRLPVVVGGTGLYLRALMTGLSRIPTVPAEHRLAAERRFGEIGAAAFHAELARIDPVAAQRLSPNDRQRMIRAREVFEATGRPLSDWQREPPETAGQGYRFATMVLAPPRADLYAAIDARFQRMVDHGAVDEARRFAALGLDPALPATKAIGLRPLIRHAAEEISLTEALELGQRESRRYAKRQGTWFRHQIIPQITLETKLSECRNTRIFALISGFLLTAAR
jgi:tRNA dimethylallyltransferase